MKNKLTTFGLGISSLFFLGFGGSDEQEISTTQTTTNTSSEESFNYETELAKASAIIQDAMNNTPIKYVDNANNFMLLFSNNNLSGEIEVATSSTILNSYQGYSSITFLINNGVSAEIFYAWNKAITEDGINHFDIGTRVLSATSITHPQLNYFYASNDINKSQKTDLNDSLCSQAADFFAQNPIQLKMNAEIKNEVNDEKNI